NTAHRFGGSHAQQDVLDLKVAQAGDGALAEASLPKRWDRHSPSEGTSKTRDYPTIVIGLLG
ncbi:MAG: hypothetical protein WAM94_07900, partial [Chromatiaceae bacterium]